MDTEFGFLKCPICLDVIKNAFVTKCGHSFCYNCIVEQLKIKKQCPVCFNYLDRSLLFPNFSLNRVISNTIFEGRQAISAISIDTFDNTTNSLAFPLTTDLDTLCRTLLSTNQVPIDTNTLDTIMDVLFTKRQKLVYEGRIMEYELLMDFLKKAKIQKQQLLDKLSKELSMLDQDISFIRNKLDQFDSKKTDSSISSSIEDDKMPPLLSTPSSQQTQVQQINTNSLLAQVPTCPQEQDDRSKPTIKKRILSSDRIVADDMTQITNDETTSVGTEYGDDDLINPSRNKRSMNQQAFHTITHLDDICQKQVKELQSRKKKMLQHFEDLQTFYFQNRNNHQSEISDNEDMNHLVDFHNQLNTCTRYVDMKTVASLRYGDTYHSSNIVSSVELDVEDRFLAMAGVAKRIKIFDYDQVISDNVEIQYPVKEMSCNSKISCLSWNAYIKSHMASSDYEGLITVWDSELGKVVQTFEEHERRTWSVDFSRIDPMRLASGSDDSKVKIWSVNISHSVLTIDSKANICCVKFNPYVSNLLAFGSADHFVHYYDLRRTKEPLYIFKGHKKAVSYVKFLSKDCIISASTDSTLKSWMANNQENVYSHEQPSMTFSGHVNEKNFVGLAILPPENEEYAKNESGHSVPLIACGSENNSVYVYTHALSKPVLNYKFRSGTGTCQDTQNNTILGITTHRINNGNDTRTSESITTVNRESGNNDPAYTSHTYGSYSSAYSIYSNNTRTSTGITSILSMDESTEDDGPHFVSSLCWNRKRRTLLAANSQGIIKVLKPVAFS